MSLLATLDSYLAGLGDFALMARAVSRRIKLAGSTVRSLRHS